MRFKVFAIGCLIVAADGCWSQQTKANPSVEQPYTPTLTFDIASIHESPPADSYRVGGSNSPHSSEANLTNMDVMNLLAIAYGVEHAQIAGLPDSMRRVMFNINAKSDSATDDRLARLSDANGWMEKQHMFQVLLADRFRLKVHWETRSGRTYNLVVAKQGPKLHPAGSLQPTSTEKETFGDAAVPAIYQRGDGRRGYEFIGHACPIDSLAKMLTSQMGAPVINKTGLADKYDFVLQYHGARSDDTNDDPAVWPALEMAVPDQLGLKLESSTGEKKFLIVDHVEMPSAN